MKAKEQLELEKKQKEARKNHEKQLKLGELRSKNPDFNRHTYNWSNRDIWEEMLTYEVNRDVDKYYSKYGFDMNTPNGNKSWNNQGDAFKHNYMQALLTLRYDNNIAKAIGDLHEYKGYQKGSPENESNMDLRNNSRGRSSGNQIIWDLWKSNVDYDSIPEQKIKDWVAESIMQKMYKGELTTTPNDIRRHDEPSIFQGLQKNWQKAEQKDNYIKLRASKVGFNPFKIFSLEEVSKKMPQDVWKSVSEPIMFQLRNLGGFPKGDELKQDVNSGDLEYVYPYDGHSASRYVTSGGQVWVEPYTRDDGTEVRGYYRARPRQAY